MDVYRSSKKSKLTFKGQKSVTKNRKAKRPRDGYERDALADMPDLGWLLCESQKDISGPLFIYFRGPDLNYVLTANADKDVLLSPTQSPSSDCEPEMVSQVFFILKLPIVRNGEAVYSLKSSSDRFMSCDRYGVITCEKEAVGMHEEWSIVGRPDGFAFMSLAFGKFLEPMYDERGVRCDSEEIGAMHVWSVKCQAQEKKRRLMAEREREKAEMELNMDPESTELEQIQKYQSHHIGNLSGPHTMGNSGVLRLAQKKGNLNEAMLDRREKSKSDKYCK